jgi:hypothetical protein
MKTFKPLGIIVVCAVLSAAFPALCLARESISLKQDEYYMNINAGLNLLQRGFPQYTNNYCVGADLYIPSRAAGEIWWSAWRVSFDYFPLIVPEGVYGTTEDLFDLSFSKVLFYPINERETSMFFGGLGFGVYGDWVRLDTPATGYMSHISYHPGLSVSLGWRAKLSNSLEIVPELRSHFAYVAREYFTVNTSIGIGLLWQFDKREDYSD